MTGQDLKDWADSLKLSNSEAAELLGVTPDHFTRMTKLAKVKEPYALACRAIYHRMKPWPHRD